jgi:hypothetical protein
MDALKKFSQFFGLHPLVGFGMFAVDLMLFGVESATLQAGWLITIPVAIALTIPCTLIQKHSYGDNWGTAIGKGMLIGVLTAIPTPLPSVVPFIGGALGLVKMLGEGRGEKPGDKKPGSEKPD